MRKPRQVHSHTARRPTADPVHISGPSTKISPIIRDSEDGAILTVHVQPKATRSVCVGIYGDALKIRVAASPVAGAANRELLRFLAGALSLPTASVRIESGESSRHKRVQLKGMTAAGVMSRLMPQGEPKE